MSDPAARMGSCPRPHHLSSPARPALSVLRCCSRSWRSWPVSATRSTGASWRSWPRSTATNCGATPAPGRSRRWWPGRPGTSPRNAETIVAVAEPAGGVPPLRRGPARGPVVPRSGRCHRRARRRRLRRALRRTGRKCHGHPAAHRGQARTTTRPRSPTRTGAVDHQDQRRRTPPTGSGCRTPRPRSSTPPCSPITTGWSPTGNATTTAGDRESEQAPPFPDTVDAFMSLVEAGWDAEAARRPHGQHTTVVMHLDVTQRTRRAASGSAAHRGRPPIPDL